MRWPVYEAQPWDVVSIPNGAAAAKKAIQHNYEWIAHYDKIVLFFRQRSCRCTGV